MSLQHDEHDEPDAVPSGELHGITLTSSHWAALRTHAARLGPVLSLHYVTLDIASELAELAQGQPMTGSRLAEILRAERARWDVLLSQVGLERMDLPDVEGPWSVKELVWHLAWYERAVVEGIREVLRTGASTSGSPDEQPEVNARIAAGASASPTRAVLAEAQRVFLQMLALVEVCPEDLLNDPRVSGLPEDVVPWVALVNASYAHYRAHEPALQAWLAKQKQ